MVCVCIQRIVGFRQVTLRGFRVTHLDDQTLLSVITRHELRLVVSSHDAFVMVVDHHIGV